MSGGLPRNEHTRRVLVRVGRGGQCSGDGKVSGLRLSCTSDSLWKRASISHLQNGNGCSSLTEWS